MFTFLLILHALIAASLVVVILMQRSEGGGLTGGSPSGLMTARGAADFLTRATAILASLFVLSSIFLAVLATVSNAPSKIDTSLARPGAATPAPAQTPGVPGVGQPATPACLSSRLNSLISSRRRAAYSKRSSAEASCISSSSVWMRRPRSCGARSRNSSR